MPISKIAVVGAAGNLGHRVVTHALDHGLDVRAMVRNPEQADAIDARAEIVCGDLFKMTAEDLEGVDVLVSAFGSGLSSDPSLNEKACAAYIELARTAGVSIVAIMGSGSLFADDTRTTRVYELPGASQRLRPISEATARGLALLDDAGDVDWCAVTPGLTFDPNGSFHDVCDVKLDLSRVVQAQEVSYSTYEDVAETMVRMASDGNHVHELVCVLSPRA
mgnify:CR=1 FL=1